MKKIVIVVLTLGIGFSANAQYYNKVSGFLGKRFSIGGGITLSPSNQPQKVVEAGIDPKYDFSLNRSVHADLQYVIGTYNALTFTIGSMTTSANIDIDRYYSNDITWGGRTNGTPANELLLYTGSPKIQDLFYGLHFKRFLFGKGAIAPVGTYAQIGFNIHNYKIDYSQLRMVVSSSDDFGNRSSIEHKMEFNEAQTSKVEILAAVGKSRPITDKLLIDYCMSAGLHGPFYNDDNVSQSDYLKNPAAAEAVKQTLVRTRQLHYLKLSITLTGLLF